MNKRNTRRLMLNKETLRNLQDRELSLVMGGVNAQSVDAYPDARVHMEQEIVVSHGASCSCPLGAHGPYWKPGD